MKVRAGIAKISEEVKSAKSKLLEELSEVKDFGIYGVKASACMYQNYIQLCVPYKMQSILYYDQSINDLKLMTKSCFDIQASMQ